MSGVADTAKLLASLDLQDTMSPKLRSAIGNVSAAENKVGSLSSRVTAFASNLSGGASRALSHFTGQLGNLARYGAAALGVGGFLSLGAIIGGSISKLEEFSLALEKVQTLTGETARDSGTLILLFEKFGLSLDQVGTFAGFAEKTLGKLNEATAKNAKAAKSAALEELERQKLERQAAGLSTKRIDALIREQKATDALNTSLANAADGTTKLQALDKQYGLALVSASGKTVSFSEELRQLADFYDRNHDAAQRAYVASTLLGRGYAALAPILNQGSDAIRAAAAEADTLGLGSQATADQIEKFRTQMRDLGVQASVLQLQIGMALIPVISHFASDVSQFITAHGSDITAFFRNAGTTAEQLAGTLGDLAGKVGAFWGSLPGPFRDLLVKGVATDRVVHFLFGFSPIGAALKGIENALVSAVASGTGKGLVSAGLGKLFVQPVFVTNPGFGAGLPGGVAGAAEGAGAAEAAAGAGSLGLGGTAAVLAAPIALALIPYLVAALLPRNPANFTPNPTSTQYGTSRPSFGAPPVTVVVPSILTTLAASERADATAADRAYVEATKDLDQSLLANTAALHKNAAAPWLRKLEDSWRRAGQTMHDKIAEAIKGLTGPHAGLAAAFLGSHLGQSGFGAGGLKQAEQIIAALKGLHSNDPAVIHAIDRLTAQLPRLKADAKDLAAAVKIAEGSDPKNAKLDELNKIMADLRAHGDPTTRRKVEDLITAVRNKKSKVTTNVTTNISVSTSVTANSVTKTVGTKQTTRVGGTNDVYVG